MGASNAFQTDLLSLFFNNTSIANIGDATGIVGSTGVGSLFIALHTADPTAAGNQSTNETTYTGYARQAVARTSGAFAVSGSSPAQVVNVSTITFPSSTAGTPTITHFSIGYQVSGATKIMISGAVTNPQVINIGGTNSFAAGVLKGTVI